jgi:hypothetical protein
MKLKMVSIFLSSAGVLLIFTAIAKFISANGSAAILQNSDPILSIHFRHVLWIIGTFELVAALVCFLSKRLFLKAGLIASVATNFLLYRLGLVWIGYHKRCPCLGNLTDALHIPPQTADTAMKIILAYLLIGSYATLFWLWRQRKKLPATASPGTSYPAQSPAP